MVKGAYIRIYDDLLKDGKFFKGAFHDNITDYEVVYRRIGFFIACLSILKHAGATGFAYSGGKPMPPAECVLQIGGLSARDFSKYLADLKECELIIEDKNKAWGVGEEKWERYQGAVLRVQQYKHNYYTAHPEKFRKQPSVPVRPENEQP